MKETPQTTQKTEARTDITNHWWPDKMPRITRGIFPVMTSWLAAGDEKRLRLALYQALLD